MKATIKAIDYYLGDVAETNEELAAKHPDWNIEQVAAKTGIRIRRKARENECASDLAVKAAERLFERRGVNRDDVDFLIFCTQSPDYLLPTTACLLQNRLGLALTVGAFDINLGCSGYVYSLAVARGLIEAGLAQNLLLLTADTYSRYLIPGDRSTWSLFGDAASASLITGQGSGGGIHHFDFGSDGRGEFNLIRPGSAARPMADTLARMGAEGTPDKLMEDRVFMAGKRIITFASEAVPKTMKRLLDKSGLTWNDIDWYIFHQASEYMLGHLTSKMKLPPEKVIIDFDEVGNTISSTIPITLCNLVDAGRVKPGDRILLVGFGVGYSWASSLVEWQ
jgi:3-oxoacyl-[acyl-carrier-protein] synthase III